jgi:hypothetical protein
MYNRISVLQTPSEQVLWWYSTSLYIKIKVIRFVKSADLSLFPCLGITLLLCTVIDILPNENFIYIQPYYVLHSRGSLQFQIFLLVWQIKWMSSSYSSKWNINVTQKFSTLTAPNRNTPHRFSLTSGYSLLSNRAVNPSRRWQVFT